MPHVECKKRRDKLDRVPVLQMERGGIAEIADKTEAICIMK